MPHSVSGLRLSSGLRPVSRLRRVSAFVPAPGVTPPPGERARTVFDNGEPVSAGADLAGAASARAPAFGGVEVSDSMGEIPLGVRLMLAFLTIGFLAISGAFVANLQIGQIVGAGDAAEATAGRAQLITFAMAGATALLAVVLGVLITRSIAGPVTEITEAMDRLSSGDTSAALPQRLGGDEIGRMTRAIAVFRDQALKVQALTAERERERLEEEAKREALRGQLAERLQAAVGEQVAQVKHEVAAMRDLSTRMVDSQTAAIERSGEMSEAAEDGLKLAMGFADAVERLSAATSSIQQRVEEGAQLSAEAAERAGETDADIAALVAAADDISRVTDLISEIAGQTKILALNAQVEAMRAGQAGASFIVVAEEVKTLSSRTSDAVAEVSRQVDQIRDRTGRTAGKVRAIIDSVGAIDGAVREISGAVAEQLTEARRIAEDAATSRERHERVGGAIQALREDAETTSEAARRVDAGAEAVRERVETLDGEFSGFLQQSRTA